MMSLAEEIQNISENADKCINYPIGDKLEVFINLQDDAKQTNFVLSGVCIFAAAKIYGRKVDYLEQEIHGIAKNFEAVSSEEKQPEKEKKKGGRTKKFVIKDRVNIDKITFEEKPIQVLQKVDINKTLALPSRIDRLQRMKEFFSKNKTKTGKLVIPKGLLFSNENIVSNFGSTQIHDYDDNKDIVGSRRDFTSFSYFINSCTGELQSDVGHMTGSGMTNEDFIRGNQENIPAPQSPVNWDISRPNTPVDNLRESSIEPELAQLPEVCVASPDFGKDPDADPNSLINLSDEGIERDASSLFPPDTSGNISPVDVNHSLLNVCDELAKNALPTKTTTEKDENKIMNIFLVPLKKLKHRCLFVLPDEEFGEMKRMKREQHKGLPSEPPMKQMRLFKPFDLSSESDAVVDPSDDPPFLGFTRRQQEMSMTQIEYDTVRQEVTAQDKTLLSEISRNYSTDSGLVMDSSDDLGQTTTDFDFGQTSSEDQIDCEDTTRENLSDANTSAESGEPSNVEEESLENEHDGNVNISGGDSCYHSLISGESSKTELTSLFRDIETRHNTIYEEEEETFEPQDDSFHDSEERVAQMQQSAMNIAKWKEYLKPILAGSEARSKIDMHLYGVEMIGKIGNVNDTVSLADITEPGKTPAYFLSMLQLINNRNVEINHGARSMNEPVDIRKIQITLKSKVLHKEKFDEMGQQFTLEEEKKVNLKRKALHTSTPAKRSLISARPSLNFNSPNGSQSMIEANEQDSLILSQASSGYFSQSSMLSDC